MFGFQYAQKKKKKLCLKVENDSLLDTYFMSWTFQGEHVPSWDSLHWLSDPFWSHRIKCYMLATWKI